MNSICLHCIRFHSINCFTLYFLFSLSFFSFFFFLLQKSAFSYNPFQDNRRRETMIGKSNEEFSFNFNRFTYFIR